MSQYCKTSLLLIYLFALALAIIPSYSQDFPQDFLDAHNTARAEVGVEPLTWSDEVAAYAQSYANQRIGDCSLIHSGVQQYGENIAMSWGSLQLSGRDAVNMWVAEKAYYDHDSNTCTGAQECLHYTQVIWRNSAQLGCARVNCITGGTFITCNYSPPGNIIGQRPH